MAKTTEEKIAEYDRKIEYHKKCIENLELAKEAAKNPKKRGGYRKKNVTTIAKKLGDAETAKRLGMTVEELRAKLDTD